MKANVDVLEMEAGGNEWLEGIQTQISRLTTLTNDLVYLSRMEESADSMQMIPFPFSDVVSETASAFHALAQTQNKIFQCNVEPMLSLTGNETAIRQLVNILMDNAMKYSPEEGQVSLTVQKHGRQIRLSVFNSTCAPCKGAGDTYTGARPSVVRTFAPSKERGSAIRFIGRVERDSSP